MDGQEVKAISTNEIMNGWVLILLHFDLFHYYSLMNIYYFYKNKTSF